MSGSTRTPAPPPAARPQTAPTRKKQPGDEIPPLPNGTLMSYDALVFKWARLHHAADQGGKVDDDNDESHADEEGVPAESVAYARQLVEYASTLCGVEISFIQGKSAFRELLKPAAQNHKVDDKKKRKKKPLGDDEEIQETSPKNQKQNPREEEARQDEIEQIEKQVSADSKSQKITPLVALQRLRQNHQFLVRTFVRVDAECQRQVYEQRTFATKSADQGSGGGRHQRSSAVLAGVSSRMGRQRASYTRRALRVVTDMREVVETRKRELQRKLDVQQKETEERVRMAEAKRRTEQRIRDAKSRELQRGWESDKQRVKEKADSKKKLDKERLKKTAEFEEKIDVAATRKYLYWQDHAGAVAAKRVARDDLYAYNASLKKRQQDEETSQNHRDNYQRNEALRIRNVMQHTQAFDRKQQRENHQAHAYKTALYREEERQRHIGDVRNQREDREKRVIRQQLEQMRRSDLASRQSQANRDAVFNNARDLQYKKAKATDELMSLQGELSKRHREECDERQALRRDYIRQQNINRMELAAQHAATIAYKEKTRREQWEKRKGTLEAQDREIQKMKDQLRQDKERLAMQTQHLKLSQRKGDMKKLDRELQRLDAALADAGDDEEEEEEDDDQ